MSLNDADRRATSEELRANLSLSGLSTEQVAVDLDLGLTELERLFEVAIAVPPDRVWALRDYLEAAVIANGVQPHPYSRLTESMRGLAAGWFGIAPRRDQ